MDGRNCIAANDFLRDLRDGTSRLEPLSGAIR